MAFNRLILECSYHPDGARILSSVFEQNPQGFLRLASANGQFDPHALAAAAARYSADGNEAAFNLALERAQYPESETLRAVLENGAAFAGIAVGFIPGVGEIQDGYTVYRNLEDGKYYAATAAGGLILLGAITGPILDGARAILRSGETIVVGTAREVVRSIDEIAPNGIVPSIRNGEFDLWYEDLSAVELQQVWSDPKLRAKIETRIRYPGGLHEWCMVCRLPSFKAWGVSVEEIRRFRTRTKDLNWIHPETGIAGGHIDKIGSGDFHNELRDIIDNSETLDEFNFGVTNLVDRWSIDPSSLPSLVQ